MMGNGHHLLLLLVLCSITFCTCMPRRTSESTLEYLKDFSPKHAENMVDFLLQKEKYQTILDILPDLHRMYPDNESLYIIGGVVTRQVDLQGEDHGVSYREMVKFTIIHMIKFLECSIGSEDYDTVEAALPILEEKIAYGQQYPTSVTLPTDEIIARSKALREEIQNRMARSQSERLVPTDAHE